MSRFAMVDSLQMRYAWGEAFATDSLILGPSPHDDASRFWAGSEPPNSSQIFQTSLPTEPEKVRAIITPTSPPASSPAATFRVSRVAPGTKLPEAKPRESAGRLPDAEVEKTVGENSRSEQILLRARESLPPAAGEMSRLIFKHEGDERRSTSADKLSGDDAGTTEVTLRAKREPLPPAAGEMSPLIFKEATERPSTSTADKISSDDPATTQSTLPAKPGPLPPSPREIPPLVLKHEAAERLPEIPPSSQELNRSGSTDAINAGTEHATPVRRATRHDDTKNEAAGYAPPRSTESDNFLTRRKSHTSQFTALEPKDEQPDTSMPVAPLNSRRLAPNTDNSSRSPAPLIWRDAPIPAETFLHSTSTTGREKFASGQSGNAAKEEAPEKQTRSQQPPNNAEINVGRITEQVIRNIARRLTVERERRGDER
jgi:hypothetical protein